MTTVLEVDQTRIAAPDFPRPLTWWRGFVPAWASLGPGPNGTVRVWVDGNRRCGRALGAWLRGAGTTGRLAEAVTETSQFPVTRRSN